MPQLNPDRIATGKSVAIQAAILASNTDLYTAFVISGQNFATLQSLEFCNTGSADITVSVWHLNAAGSTLTYICKNIVVPANDVVSWEGAVGLDASSEKIRAIASATGVDVNGIVVEKSQ